MPWGYEEVLDMPEFDRHWHLRKLTELMKAK